VVVLVVLSHRRARTATSLLMVNLAVADLVFIVVCVPTTAARYALPVWPLGTVWCKVIDVHHHCHHSSFITSYKNLPRDARVIVENMRGSMVERQSLASVLLPSCARPVADG